MKTKITSFLWSALLCAMTFATGAFADTESGFYEKEHIRGFISIGADYRGMFSEYQKYVNKTAFLNGYHKDPTGDSTKYAGDLKYETFDDYYFGMHVNIGAQYKQFLTWFDINFMPTQTSERPSSSYSATSEDGSTSMKFPLYDVRWFAYGADWMFGWKLFGENTFINLIPAVGFGFNLINFHLASNFEVYDVNDKSSVSMRDRYYSTFASTFNSELELRLEFGPIAVGAYGGYRCVRYNELEIEGKKIDTAYGDYDTDNIGDTWFVGVRLTWIFRSEWQKKQDDKL
ncbi:MAG: hypothetical protein II819_11285 [Fibrobacter sp.]|nr:hypothetical protein [Fibrobacter sp.]